MDATPIATFFSSVSLPVAIALIVGGSFAFLVAWGMYSAKVQKSLKRGTFGVMEILSEARDDYGDPSKIPEVARRFRRGSLTDIRRSFVRIGGDSFRALSSSRRGSVRVQGDVAFRYYSDESGDGELKRAIYGRKGKATDLSLRELVSEKTPMMEIEEDVFKRMNWTKRMDECVSIRDLPENDAGAGIPAIGGARTFCYRDYVNHEELMGMMWKRGGIEGFLFKPSRADVVTIDEDTGECALSASSRLFRVVPISIRWEGTLVDGETVRWDTTSLAMGWESFGKVFDKPAAAEKLRKDPWHISIHPSDAEGDILCFHREGKGRLVFAREECLSKGVKSQ